MTHHTQPGRESVIPRHAHILHVCRRWSTFLLIIPILLWQLIGTSFAASCSTDYFGKAFLNEYYFGNSTPPGHFIEVFIPNNQEVPSSDTQDWSIQVHQQNSIQTYNLSDSLVCPYGSKAYYAIPASNLPGGNYDVNIVLLDGNHNEIDYFKFRQNNPPGEIVSPLCTYPADHDISLQISNMGNRNLARFPDGTGQWSRTEDQGANTSHTYCLSNDATLFKTASSSQIGLGNSGYFTVAVTNPSSNRTLSDLHIIDTWPEDLTLTDSTCSHGDCSDPFNWTINSLGTEQVASLTLNFEAHVIGTFENRASMTYTMQNSTYSSSDTAIVNITPSIDHIRLAHSANGLTCSPVDVTFTACADEACTQQYMGGVSFTLTKDGVDAANIVIPDGSASVVRAVSHSVAETITLGVSNISPPAARNPAYQCNSGNCEITFVDVGILIDGNIGDLSSLTSDIPVQIAGKPSNIGFNAATQLVRVVRTDTQTGACIAGVENQTLDATFNYLVPTVGEGLSDNTIGVSGASNANLTTAGIGQTVQLEFDNYGTAPFSFTSQDAGRYQLGVAMNIPVTDTDGIPTGDIIPASNTSNIFLARPLAMFADASGNPRSQDAAGSTYQKAGETFSMAFHSLRWAAGRDNDNDGLWDNCGNTDLTDPGNYSRVPVWDIGQPAAYLALPIGGSNPGLNYADGNIGFSAGTSTVTADNVSYDEVGIVQLQTNGMNNFFGEAVEVCSPYIGRFIPAQFVIEAGNILNRASIPTCSSSFTYMGEPFEANLTLAAKNASGIITTANYRGDFARLDDESLNIGAIDRAITSTPLTDRLNIAAVTRVSDWGDAPQGKADYTLSLYIAREASPDGSFDDVAIGINPLDDDGVVLGTLNLDINDDGTDTHGILGSTIIRYGRLRLQNAHGSELINLPVHLVAESYHTSGYFTKNTDDICTAISLSDHILLNGSSGDSNPVSLVGSGSTHILSIDSPFITGQSEMLFVAPGSGNTGYVDIQSNIGTDLPWLLFDWDGDGSDDEASSRATFGIYQGSDRKIYMRERY